MEDPDQRGGWRRWGVAAALVASGLLAGGVLAGTLTAGAQTGTSGPASAYGAAPGYGPTGDGPTGDGPTGDGPTGDGPTGNGPTGNGTVDESKSQRPDEQLLTGDTATKVRDAALAEYPGATVLRVETDSDGVYEAHLTTADGQRVTVAVGEDFAVTGTESAPGRGTRPAQGGDTPQQS